MGGVKGKITQVGKLVKQTYELVDAVLKGLEDDKLTREEIELIKEEAEDVKLAWFELIGKNKVV